MLTKLRNLLWDLGICSYGGEDPTTAKQRNFSRTLSVVAQDREERGDLEGAYKAYRKRIYICPGHYSFRRDMLLAWEEAHHRKEQDIMLLAHEKSDATRQE
ncbi:MAG: hypothetical protein IPN70_04635 [Candidatus Moraniibacteriota bacterium]|nr:MAG: hypothetical protein IPN70_04635 [Candidatus Moranbacteria bacterium]